MCGRYKLEDPIIAFSFIEAPVDSDFKPRFNIAPTQKIAVSPSRGKIQEMRWGLVPAWAQGKSNILINARSETIREKHSFKKSFAERRCLVPADGFYEWTRGTKRPHLFTLKGNLPFAIGAFWDLPQEGELPRCCLVTTSANKILEPIHDRMPVIVHKKDWTQWLEPGELEDQMFSRLTVPYSPDEMQAVEVSPIVNSAREDSSKCIEALRSRAD